jgi:UPF0716 protein FxsA
VGKLLLLFIIVPLVDAWLLFQIAGILGFAGTLALVLVTGVVGAWLFRLEGTRTWAKWQASLAEGRVPEEGVLGGVMLLLGGALLVTPGVITDAVGLVLLLPPTRRLIAAALRPRLSQFVKDKAISAIETGSVRVVSSVQFGGFHSDLGDEPVSTEVIARRIPLESGHDQQQRPDEQRPDEQRPDEQRPDEQRRPEVIDADFEIKPD